MLNFLSLIDQAKDILANNYLVKFTKPAPSLYPYQWNWDSGFIAMAYAQYDLTKAKQEITSLLEGQWSNGMLPQIVFHFDSDLYFPGPYFWQTKDLASSPDQITSGITMPPVWGFVLEYLYIQAHDEGDILEFVSSVWDKIISYHRFLYEERDVTKEGLPPIIHPWESGTDNSSIYDEPLAKMGIENLKVPFYKRKDLQSPGAEKHRPTKIDYDRYVYLVDLFRKNKYQTDKIVNETPFLVQDPLFCSILSASNKALKRLGEKLGHSVKMIEEWDQLTESSMNKKLWDKRGIYNAYDLVNESIIPVYSHSGFMPLFAHIPSKKQASIMKEYLFQDFTEHGKSYLVPSHSLAHSKFEAERYWRGPVWLNINWMLASGFSQYEYKDVAERIREDSLKLIEEFGFFEYFNPIKTIAQKGCGTDQFSWTAAMSLVFAADKTK